METPLTPLDFLRRAGKLYGSRLAVVDGDLRLTYAQFRDRCDRWTAGLGALGVGKGDRVATISPNTHQHLEQFYAIPQRGAVIVPMNFRLTADDFVYMATHSGAKAICVHSDYLDVIDTVRQRMPTVKHFIALEGEKSGWLRYETLLEQPAAVIDVNEIVESDLLALN
jgi:fatty-acyl-CoA synthase